MEHTIHPVDLTTLGAAENLLDRFFREESFAAQHASIHANLAAMLAEPDNWAGLAWRDAVAVGIVTVTTALHVEWGRLGEIGDLYVLPEMRGQGIGRALVSAGIEQCSARGCSAASVTITPGGETAHGLARYYGRFGFVSSGRTTASLRLS